jgi:hypothetical protein
MLNNKLWAHLSERPLWLKAMKGVTSTELHSVADYKKTAPHNSRFIQLTNLYFTDHICMSCLELHCAISLIYVTTYVLGVRIRLGIHAVHGVTTLNNSLSVSYNMLVTNRNQGSVVSIVDTLQGLMTKESWHNSWQRQAIPPFYRACGLILGH